ncbi:hypothetical protein QZH41_003145 [Actinostola sp. cb2023]|nr:hypothetical protein QZH41_003145 [Actinostola sp. cb2023]
MDTGKHRLEVDCESMYDRIRRKWAGVVTGVTFAVDVPSTSAHAQEGSAIGPATTDARRRGWALKTTKRPSRMSERVKAFLEFKFEEGARTGNKSDPVQLARELKTAKNEHGQLVFTPDEWRTAQQINSLFSRLTVAQRQRGMEGVLEEDTEAAESEMALKDLRSLVMNDMESPNHPVIVHGHNKEEIVMEFSKLFTGLGKMDTEYHIEMEERAEPYAIYTARRIALPLLPKNSSTPMVTSSHPMTNLTSPVTTARPVDTQYHDPVEGSQTFRPPALRPMPPTNSPWRGQWNTPEQFFSTVPNSNKEIPKLQELWGQIPAFTGPPQDQWIDQLDEAYQFQPEGVHRRYTYGSSAFERSLPKFELSKFDGSPMAWPDWISRYKSVVHDQTFLNDNQRMAYLQTLVTSAAKTEIQYLGEDGMSYTLALRILKSIFADAGKIVRAAITQLKNTPSPRTNDHHAIVKLYQALRSAVITLHRQRLIADLISETNLAIVLEKLPDQLAIKWAMEVQKQVQKHECYGRPNLFNFDRWLSEQVRCRQHLVHEESVQPITKPKFNARRDNSIRVNTLATSTNHNTTSDGKDKGTGTCPCCKQLHAIYRCNDFTKRKHYNDNNPYALKTDLGWGIIGKYNDDANDNNEEDYIDVSHRIISCEVTNPEASRYLSCRTKTKEVLGPLQVNKMFELDISEVATKKETLSYEEKSFLQKMENGIVQRSDGHYQMPLPFREEIPNLPNNNALASHRLKKLQQRMAHDDKYYSMYKAAMRRVMLRKFPSPKRRQKTERQEPFAFIGDIEGMFHQFKVEEEHRDFLRFLWWENGNLKGTPDEYRTTVHLFGAKSSPGCSNYGLKKVADDYEDEFGLKVADFIRNDFYVDDGLKSLPQKNRLFQ